MKSIFRRLRPSPAMVIACTCTRSRARWNERGRDSSLAQEQCRHEAAQEKRSHFGQGQEPLAAGRGLQGRAASTRAPGRTRRTWRTCGAPGQQGIQGVPGNPSTAGRVGSTLGADGAFGGGSHLPVVAVTLTVPADATRVNVSGGVTVTGTAAAMDYAIRFTQDTATCWFQPPAYYDASAELRGSVEHVRESGVRRNAGRPHLSHLPGHRGSGELLDPHIVADD